MPVAGSTAAIAAALLFVPGAPNLAADHLDPPPSTDLAVDPPPDITAAIACNSD